MGLRDLLLTPRGKKGPTKPSEEVASPRNETATPKIQPVVKIHDGTPPDEEASIQVVCRFRPYNAREKAIGLDKADGEPLFTLGVDSVKFQDIGGEYVNFKVSTVFGMESSQEDVYRSVAEKAMTDLFSGYNATVFAYGQTGSGKSFTMFGDLKDLSLRGLIPRCTESIFQTIKSGAVRGSTITIKCSYVELYQEVITDLLRPQNTNLQLREDPQKGVYVDQLSYEFVGSVVDVYQLITLGDMAKKKRATKMNPNSSRSHCCFTVTLEQVAEDGRCSRSQLNLVDLAGSERISKTQVSGQSLEEAKKINLSLSALSQVINALADNQGFIPYRGSKLTRLLQSSLGGNSKTSMIVACSPHPDNREETMGSLRFAQRCASVKNRVTRNTVLTAEQLQAMLSYAQQEILRATGGSSDKIGIDMYTQTEDGGISVVEDDQEDLKDLQKQLEKALAREKELVKEMEDKDAQVERSFQRENELRHEVIKLENLIQVLNNKIAGAKSMQTPYDEPSRKGRRLSSLGGMITKSMSNVPGKMGAISHSMMEIRHRKRSSTSSLDADAIDINLLKPRNSASGALFPVVSTQEPNLVDIDEHVGESESSHMTIPITVPDGGDEGPSSFAPVPIPVPSPVLSNHRLVSSSEAPANMFNQPPITIGIENDEDDEIEPSRKDSGLEWRQKKEAERHEVESELEQVRMNTRAELEKLSRAKLETAVEEEHRKYVRVSAQLDDQGKILTKQSAKLKEFEKENAYLRVEKKENEVKIEELERELLRLREKLMRKEDDGGAKIIVPIKENSVLEPMRQQQAAGQLGEILNVFSLFGGEDDGKPRASMSDKMSKMLSSFNPFA